MRKDDRRNIVDIKGTLNNSPVTVNQNQDGEQSITNKHIEYVVDEGTVRVFPQKPSEKKNFIFLVTMGISALALFSDLLGVLSYFGIQKGMIAVVLAPVCLVIMLFTNRDRWLVSLPKNGTAKFRDGQWYEKLDDGNFISYEKKAKCIYPKCTGLVQAVPAPPRERDNHSLVGKCTVGGVRHTYTIDYNGIGYPHEFDWRPVEDHKKT